MIHHRTPEFSRELAEMNELMRPFFGTREPVLPVHATGRIVVRWNDRVLEIPAEITVAK